MVIAGEETFGPVAPLYRFNADERGGFRMTNDNKFGLAAYFYRRNIGHICWIQAAF
jgi:succinate-semialdehyde dehydrogenase / glutarate-semialdehyde dehydrogenase